MSYLLPESTLNQQALKEFIQKLEKIYLDFEIEEYRFLDSEHQTHTFLNLSELLNRLETTPPMDRGKVSLKFKFRRTSKVKNRTSGTISLNSSPELSAVEISGGRRDDQNQEKQRIGGVFSTFKRTVTNKVMVSIFLPTIPLFLFIFNYCLFPDRLVAGTALGSFVSGAITFPFLLYGFYRPHIFFSFENTDFLSVFPNIYRTLLAAFIWISLVWAITQSPKWLGRDDMMVANNPSIQRELLRSVVTTPFLEKIRNLEAANKLYDSATDLSQKETAAKTITTQLNDIINGKKGLKHYPLGELKYFISSASPMQPGNWLHEPLLLYTNHHFENHKVNSTYKARLIISPEQSHETNLPTWLEEPIIKDRYGRMWTRASLLGDRLSEANGTIKEANLNDLERLREFPDEGFGIQVNNEPIKYPENSVEVESIRAISEEMVRSMIVIQRRLSESPTGPLDENMK